VDSRTAATFSSRQAAFSLGLSARTNPAGAADLRALLASIGLVSEEVEIPRGTLHLKTDCSLIDEETMLATEGLANSGVLDGFRILVVPVDERGAANALRVNDTLFIRAGCPRTYEMLVAHGLNVVPLPCLRSPRSTPGCPACRCAGSNGSDDLRAQIAFKRPARSQEGCGKPRLFRNAVDSHLNYCGE